MRLSECPRLVAQLLAVAAVVVLLLANQVSEFRIEEWPGWVRIAVLVGVVGCLTLLALRIVAKSRQDGRR